MNLAGCAPVARAFTPPRPNRVGIGDVAPSSKLNSSMNRAGLPRRRERSQIMLFSSFLIMTVVGGEYGGSSGGGGTFGGEDGGPLGGEYVGGV